MGDVAPAGDGSETYGDAGEPAAGQLHTLLRPPVLCKQSGIAERITRHKVSSDIMTRFQHDLEAYFRSGEAERKGLPSVAYFAEKVFLSPGYFGDLIKKETGIHSRAVLPLTSRVTLVR